MSVGWLRTMCEDYGLTIRIEMGPDKSLVARNYSSEGVPLEGWSWDDENIVVQADRFHKVYEAFEPALKNKHRKKGPRREETELIQGDQCLHCKEGTLTLIKEDYPYNIDHLQCISCDSTYILNEATS